MSLGIIFFIDNIHRHASCHTSTSKVVTSFYLLELKLGTALKRRRSGLGTLSECHGFHLSEKAMTSPSKTFSCFSLSY